MNFLLVISFLNESELICFHITTEIVSTHLIGFHYCYPKLLILFNINHVFADSEQVSVLLYITNN